MNKNMSVDSARALPRILDSSEEKRKVAQKELEGIWNTLSMPLDQKMDMVSDNS